MKLNTQERTLETSGISETSKFTIQASAKAFSLLSANLYKDQILAIVRELSCNAWDAHVTNGNQDQPFEVNFPTSLVPMFSVKDYGTGMSKEAIFNLYSTYFGSDKNHTNDLIGGMGVGSKTPFAYTDTFTIISRHNNRRMTFAAYLDAKQLPNISIVSDEFTDEPTGMEVSLAVRPKDYTRFQDRAYALGHFPTAVISNSDKGKKVEYKIHTENYGLRKSGSSVKVVMGNIEYPVPKSVSGYGHRVPINLFFDIGSLDFSLSREELTDSPEAKIKIDTALDEAMRDIERRLRKQLDMEPYEANRAKTIAEMYDKYGIDLGSREVRVDADAMILNTNSWDHTTLKFQAISFYTFGREYATRNWYRTRVNTNLHPFIVWIDTNKIAYRKVLKHNEALLRSRNVVLVTGTWLEVTNVFDAFDPQYSFRLSQMDMPTEEKIKLSKTAGPRKIYKRNSGVFFTQLSDHYLSQSGYNWSKRPSTRFDEVNKIAEAWVAREGINGLLDVDTWKKLEYMAKSLKLNSVKVLGIPRSLSVAEEKVNIPHYSDYLKSQITKLINELNYKKDMYVESSGERNIIGAVRKSTNIVKKCPKSAFARASNRVFKGRKYSVQDLDDAFKTLEIDPPEEFLFWKKIITRNTRRWNRVLIKRYPMLSKAVSGHGSFRIDDEYIIDYIKLAERCRDEKRLFNKQRKHYGIL